MKLYASLTTDANPWGTFREVASLAVNNKTQSDASMCGGACVCECGWVGVGSVGGN